MKQQTPCSILKYSAAGQQQYQIALIWAIISTKGMLFNISGRQTALWLSQVGCIYPGGGINAIHNGC